MKYISVGPDVLYGACGFYDPHEPHSDIENGRQSASVRFLGRPFESSHYTRPSAINVTSPSQTFIESLQRHYDGINRNFHSVAACDLVSLDHAVVAHNVVYLIDQGDPKIVFETHRSIDRSYTTLLDTSDISRAPDFAGTTEDIHFFIGSVGSFNYGHWLVDDLPRLLACDLLCTAYPGRRIRIIVSSYSAAMDRVRAQSIDALLAGRSNYDVVFISPAEPLKFRHLHYASPVSFHPVLKTAEALSSLVDRLNPEAATNGAPLFVARRPDRGRALLNFDAIRHGLEARGFQTVDPEALQFNDQVRAFASAPLVVGCMGAAMTNTLFCRPGTPLLYLAPEGWMEPFYWDLATLRQQPYAVCFGATAEPSVPAHLSAYHVEWPAVEATLKQLMSR